MSKEKETNMDFVGEFAEYSYSLIEKICNDIGPRYSSSQEEKKANLLLKDELSKFCDETNIEEFETRPNLYPQGIIRITFLIGGLAFFSILLAYPFSIIASILVFISVLVLFFELMLIKGWAKFLFRKGTSSNVYGIIKPSEEVKCRILLEGHTDSAIQMRISTIKGDSIATFLLIMSLTYNLFSFIYPIVKIILQSQTSDHYVLYDLTVFQWTKLDLFCYPVVFVLFLLNITTFSLFLGNKVVMGANDNLSGTAVAFAVGKYFSENKLKNVELIIASMGSEEVGERGAHHFVKKHPELFENSLSLVFECVGAGVELLLVEFDFMHLAKYSSEVISKFEKGYNRYKEIDSNIIPMRIGRLIIGSSDANVYTKEGYEAAFIIILDENTKHRPVQWHTINDTLEFIDKKILQDIIGISICFVEQIENNCS